MVNWGRCPACYRCDGIDWNVYGYPRLMDSLDGMNPSQWTVKDMETGTVEHLEGLSDKISHRLAMVSTTNQRPGQDAMQGVVDGDMTPEEKILNESMEKKVEQDEPGTEVVSQNFYEINLTYCKMVVLETGQSVRVTIGYPYGMSYEDMKNGTEFKIFHYKQDEYGNVTGIEEIPVTATESGLVFVVDSFSPFAVIGLEHEDGAPVVQDTTVALKANEGGHFEDAQGNKLEGDKLLVKLQDGQPQQIKVVAHEYENEESVIRSLKVAGAAQEISNNKEMTISLDKAQINGDYAEVSAEFATEEANTLEEARQEVTVEKPVVNIINTQKRTLDAGQRLMIDADVTTDEGATDSYQWYKNDVAVPGATSKTLSIDKVTPSDTGNYKLAVTSEKEGLSASSTSANEVQVEVNCRVELDAQGGSFDGSSFITVGADGYLGQLPTPINNGQNFLGWYTQPTGGQPVSPVTRFTESTKIYAQWEPLRAGTHTVTFNAGEGLVSSNGQQTIDYRTGADGTLSELPEAYRNGWHFDGWFTEQTGGTQITTNYEFDGTTTVYAHWSKLTYEARNITFDPQGGTLVDGISVYRTSQAGKLESFPEVFRNGYVLKGWYTKENSQGEQVTTDTAFQGSTTVYAFWQSAAGVNHAVTFNPGEGGTISTGVNVYYTGSDRTLEELPHAWRNGYLFDGWYTAAQGGTAVSTSTVFDGDTEVYAHWIQPGDTGHTVTFEPNGGTLTYGISHYHVVDGAIIRDMPEVFRNGWLFDGWYTQAEGGDQVNADATVSSDMTLYAHWKQPGRTGHSVNFDANGGSLLTGISEYRTGSDGTLSELPVAFRNGRTFEGWFTEQTGGSQVTTSTVFTRDTTVYAHWETPQATGFEITFDPQGGSFVSGVYSYRTGADGTLSELPEIFRNGYIFAGWYTAPEGGSQVTTSTVFSAPQMLYARWTDPEDIGHTVTFDAKGGFFTDGINAYRTGADGTLSELPVPHRNGYLFTGWTLEDGTPVTTSTVFSADTAVNANWEKPDLAGHTVTFDTQGGTLAAGIEQYRTGSDLTLEELPEVFRNGYLFDGWYTAAQGGDPVTTETSFSADTTVYAHWSRPAAGGHDITFDPAGGILTHGITVYRTSASGTLAELPEAHRNGWVFDGWFTRQTGGDPVTVSTVFDGDTEVFAHWSRPSSLGFTVSFDTAGGSFSSAVGDYRTDADGRLSELPTPHRNGFIFAGWQMPDGKIASTSTVFTGNTVLTAKWATPDVNALRVKFDPQGGTMTYGIDTYITGSDRTLPSLPEAHQNGYNFDGWYTDPQGGEKITNSTTFVSDTTVYAHWSRPEASSFEITFDATGGIFADGITVYHTHADGTLGALPAVHRNGYIFTGWADAEGRPVTTETVFTGPTAVYAQWSEPQARGHMITFDPQGGTLIHGVESYLTDASGRLDRLPVVHRNGSVFEGWFTAPEGGSPVTTDTVFDGPVTIYARWSEPQASGYTVTFDPGEGSLTYGVDQLRTDAEGRLSEMPAAHRNGYIFAGWFDSEGREADVNTVFTADTTLTARYTPATAAGYTVNFDCQGGATDTGISAYRTDADGMLSDLPNAHRNGYLFTGWYTGSTDGEQVTDATVFTADTTIYAHWEKAPEAGFDITFDPGEGHLSSGVKTWRTDAEGRLSLLPSAHRNGYIFTGWLLNDGTPAGTDTVFTENTTLHAGWQEISAEGHVLTLDTRGGTLSGGIDRLQTNAEGRLTEALPEPVRTGFVFVGWFTAPEGGEQVTAETVFTADTTLYAHWTETTPEPSADGSLTVTKQVTGETTDKVFGIKVAFEGEGVSEESVFTIAGEDKAGFTNGGTLELKSGGSATITGIPAGAAYTVTEDEESSGGYVSSVTNGRGTIQAGAGQDAVVVNRKPQDTDLSAQTGTLTISKAVSGAQDGEKPEFEFKLGLTLPEGAETQEFKYTGSKEGSIAPDGTVTLTGGQAVTISGLPAGTKYTVNETQVAGYTMSVTGEYGEIEAGKDSHAAFVNTVNGEDPGQTGQGGGQNPSDITTPSDQTGNQSGATGTTGTTDQSTGSSQTTDSSSSTDQGAAQTSSTPLTKKATATTVPSGGTTTTSGGTTTASETPKTGDESMTGTWAAVAGVSLLGIFATLHLRRRKEQKNR